MQCVNCQFENLPGVDACGRCGTSLRLAQVAIDVHPPRASRRAKRWRRSVPTFRAWAHRSNQTLSSLAEELTGPLMQVERPAPAVLRRLIVPGWPQIYCGRTLRGWLFLGGYAALLAMAAVFVGSLTGSVALGLALALHASTVFDVVMPAGRAWQAQIGAGMLICLLLGVAVYWPAAWLVTRVATPQVFQQDAPPFERGDVILYSQIAVPAPGSMVVYDIPQAQVAGQRANVYYNVQGQRIDRILAGPGQVVACRGGELVVDNAASEWHPLNPEYRPSGEWEIQVPWGCFLIVPSTDPYAMQDLAGHWREFCVVPESNIHGTVWLRNQPLSRFAFIR